MSSLENRVEEETPREKEVKTDDPKVGDGRSETDSVDNLPRNMGNTNLLEPTGDVPLQIRSDPSVISSLVKVERKRDETDNKQDEDNDKEDKDKEDKEETSQEKSEAKILAGTVRVVTAFINIYNISRFVDEKKEDDKQDDEKKDGDTSKSEDTQEIFSITGSKGMKLPRHRDQVTVFPSGCMGKLHHFFLSFALRTSRIFSQDLRIFYKK